jgi:alkylation response protein AidB-like acyl-CoA dehydrogenase
MERKGAPMNLDLQPRTEPGARLVELAEKHATDAEYGAEERDRTATFPVEVLAAMQASGFLAGCVPTELGGSGVQSVHDVAVAVNRLARADASTAIAATMHLAPPFSLARAWREAVAGGDPEHVAGVERFLTMFGSGRAIVCLAFTEPGTTLLHPQTEAVPDGEGFRLTGRKAFATNSAVAGVVGVSAKLVLPDPEAGPVFSAFFVRRDSEGLTIRDDWDAMGMRASGSNTMVLDGCFVPAANHVPLGPWGRWGPSLLSLTLAASFPLMAAFLGIAEAARGVAVETARTRRKQPTGEPVGHLHGVQRLVAEMDVELAAARGALDRAGVAIDDYYASVPPSEETLDDLHALMAHHQCANLVVKRAAMAVVDAAMTVSGGAGYMSANPLSRLYRDVRAGPFMQPYSPVEAYEYIGRVALGLDPHPEA